VKEKALDFETGNCRLAQRALPIGEKNSQSKLHNEEIQLIVCPPGAHARIEP
jgi:hypothetical protein